MDQKTNEFFELHTGFNLSHFELPHHQQNVLRGKPACLSKVCAWHRGLCLLTLHFKGASSVRADGHVWRGKINVYFAGSQHPSANLFTSSLQKVVRDLDIVVSCSITQVEKSASWTESGHIRVA